jgi:4-hydroxybenzoate polyprenyltransferase
VSAGSGRRAPAWPRWWRHPWWRHLRLGFNLILSPIYLWGVWLAGGSLASPPVWLGYVALHLFLYGGTNAFNSYYDRDDGPIGGMRHPPPVDRGLLWWSLAVQAAGLPLALAVGPAFTVTYLLLFGLASAYSHPWTRWKAHPWAALAAVALGQGGVGFLAGYVVVAGPGLRVAASLVRAEVVLGVVTAALVLTGLYVVSQAYQTADDRRRGDRTLPVLLGPRRALRLAVAVSGSGVALMTGVVAARLGWGWAASIGLGAVVVGVWWWRWAAGFDEDAVDDNFATAMRLAATGGGALTAFLVWHLAVP